MSDQAIAERVELDKKDKAELQAIVAALGGKATSRTKKADLIDSILELSGVTAAAASGDGLGPAEQSEAPTAQDDSVTDAGTSDAEGAPGSTPEDDRQRGSQANGGQPSSNQPSSGGQGADAKTGELETDVAGGDAARAGGNRPKGTGESESNRGRNRGRRGRGRNEEPPAEWETELDDGKPNKQRGDQQRGDQQRGAEQGQGNRGDQGRSDQSKNDRGGQNRQDQQKGESDQARSDQARSDQDETESGNRRRRRRGRGRDRDDNVEAASQEPVAVSGFLDLRDDGYGFLRVDGFLPSKDDVYVPVKMARQYGLRRGDLVTGTARAANRNEKNPALQQLDSINGSKPDAIGNRPNFDSLTALFPDERLRLERTRQPLDLTPRILDLIAPIGKGQRGLIVSPPKAGKTSIMKEVATSIEQNHPEVELVVLLIDERPEEVTDMIRHLERGEVVSSTFDRPIEEHCTVAELTLERAKRIVEEGKDVVILLDGITRLARAYNMAASGAGRTLSGGVDAGALYPPKKFFGAARNLEEGGSLTILATALVDTGSRMDEVIFEEFKGTGNMELRLDRSLAERHIFPAIDALGSSTRRSELLMDGPEQHSSDKLRKVLAGLAGSEDGSAAASMNLLMDRLKTFKTNEEFLREIAKSR